MLRRSDSARFSPFAELLVVLAAQAIAVTLVIRWQARVLNTDAVSYLQIAAHYRDGAFGRAVNGYWGAMLSWLIAPCLDLFPSPRSAGWAVTGASGLGFTAGCWALCRVLGLSTLDRRLAAAATAAYTATATTAIVPDWLMGGILLAGFALLMRRDWIDRRPLAFGSGTVLGLAYLAKAPALPQAVLAIAGLGLLRGVLEPERFKALGMALALTALGLLLVAGPWIATLSLKYGHLTFSTAATINHALVAPRNSSELKHVTVRQLVKPEPGRLTAWEEPSRLGYERWSPFASMPALRHQLWVTGLNSVRLFELVIRFDRLRLGLVALVVAFVGCWPWRQGLRGEPWRWSLIPAVAVCVPYLPIWVEVRYLYPILPFLLLTTLRVVRWAEAGRLGRWPMARVGVWCLVALSFLGPVAGNLRALAKPSGEDAWSEAVQAVRARGVYGPVIGDTDTAMKVAFELGLVHAGTSINLTAEEARASDATIVIVQGGSTVATSLALDEGFVEIELISPDRVALSQRAFVRRPRSPGGGRP